jgi:hypothetical protein
LTKHRSILHDTVSAFGPETWAFLGLMAVGFMVSGGSALWALIPLRLRQRTLDKDYDANIEADKPTTLPLQTCGTRNSSSCMERRPSEASRRGDGDRG